MKITTNKNCDIVIYDDTEYPVNGITYKGSVSLYLVLQNTSNHSEIIYNKLDTHDKDRYEPIILKNNNYGLVIIYHIIIPKKGYVPVIDDDPDCTFVHSNNYLTTDEIDLIISLIPIQDSSTPTSDNQDNSIIDNYGIRYYYENEKIYRYNISGDKAEVEYLELVDINPNACNIVKFTYNFFSVCLLRKCFVALCQQIFNDRGFDRCFNGKVDSLLIYKRDLVWAALNVIQYMVDSNQLAEAQRLLERINGCNGLCAGVNTGDDCGCE